MKRYRTIFCGTPDFSVPCLELLAAHPLIDMQSVVTMPDRPAGRGKQLNTPAVALAAKNMDIPLIQTANINKETLLLNDSRPDLLIVLAFAQFLSDELLDFPILGCYNIHTSLLPKYRGAAPIQHALLQGDEITGVTIQKMVKKMDAGDLVLQQAVDVAPWETAAQLYTRLKFLSACTLNNFLTNLHQDTIEARAQDHSKASFAPVLTKKDGFLDFTSMSSTSIFNRVRALNPWPGTYCFLNSRRLKILEVRLCEENLAPGILDLKSNQLKVGGLDHKAVRLVKVQPEGKKACLDYELLNGLRKLPNKDLIINPKD